MVPEATNIVKDNENRQTISNNIEKLIFFGGFLEFFCDFPGPVPKKLKKLQKKQCFFNVFFDLFGDFHCFLQCFWLPEPFSLFFTMFWQFLPKINLFFNFPFCLTGQSWPPDLPARSIKLKHHIGHTMWI